MSHLLAVLVFSFSCFVHAEQFHVRLPDFPDFDTAIGGVGDFYADGNDMDWLGGIYLQDLTNPKNVYHYTFRNWVYDEGPSRVSSLPYDAYWVGYNKGISGFFYASLPKKIEAYSPVGKKKSTYSRIRKNLLPLVVMNQTIREVAQSHQLAHDAYKKLMSMSISRNPIVAYGLKNLRYKVIFDRGDGKESSSPTHYDRNEGVLYLNADDLRNHGWVVLLHESLHVALSKSFNEKVISKTAHEKLVFMNRNYFKDFSGYVGMVGFNDKDFIEKYKLSIELNLLYSGEIGREKAFTVGYTYVLLNNHMKNFSKADADLANQFIKAVENNKEIAEVYFYVPTFSRMSFMLKMITDGDKQGKAVKKFTDLLIKKKSGPRQEIQVLYDAIVRKGLI